MKKNLAKQIAENTADSYSRSRFTDAGWRRIAQVLLDAGATAAEAEWVLNSKHTRWAADVTGKNHGVTAVDFLDYVNRAYGNVGKLVLAAREETTPKYITRTGDDLAGDATGEDIADLINLASEIARGNSPLASRAREIVVRIQERAK